MSGVVAAEGAGRGEPRRASPPPATARLSAAALVVALLTIVATFSVAAAVQAALTDLGFGGTAATAMLYLLAALAFLLLLPVAMALRSGRAVRHALATGDLVQARVAGAAARSAAQVALGYAAAVALALGTVMFVFANDMAVGRTFIYLPLMASSFHLVASAFWTNIYIFCVAEVLVLVWGLVIAIARLIPGAPGRPIRLIATVYTDIFRGLPAIITIYLVGFGLPLAKLPVLRDFPAEWYAILALTLTYGAYVAEVYRAGIESIHPSQTSAARSLGLSFFQTLRFVVVPQAVRRIIPPLLNDFISLQKDTALVSVIGAIDAFNQAKIVASNHFNLSSVSTVAVLFVLITIPQTRMVDRLIERDRRRTRPGG